MDIMEFNGLGKEAVATIFKACCGSASWSDNLLKHFPFKDEQELVARATDIWYDSCREKDWLEAFTHHPKIGDLDSLKEKFAGKEQEAVGTATASLIKELANANQDYEDKFGFIFIVCATGKSASEMLRLLKDRLKNSREEELQIAMGEQHKISILRFKKMLQSAKWNTIKQSQVTTHVLDTSLGKPGKDITIRLKQCIDEKWQTLALAVTNADGRIGDLLPPDKNLIPGNYKMVFEIENYFVANNIKSFYPVVEIDFKIFDNEHYHVPLLINPFGYSTYRGS